MPALSPRFAAACILVVEDAEFNRYLITSALNRAGFRNIEIANDGLEALEKTRLLKPELVILDLNMPNLDGFGYCERVRRDPDAPHMPIIVQTALEERAAKLRALSCGADDFLNKPLDMDELTLRVHLHLERYFMLQDMNEMCIYLKMELEQAQAMMQQMKHAAVPNSAVRMLDRHFEVLEEMAVLPTFKR